LGLFKVKTFAWVITWNFILLFWLIIIWFIFIWLLTNILSLFNILRLDEWSYQYFATFIDIRATYRTGSRPLIKWRVSMLIGAANKPIGISILLICWFFITKPWLETLWFVRTLLINNLILLRILLWYLVKFWTILFIAV